jgi:hypothetical protein
MSAYDPTRTSHRLISLSANYPKQTHTACNRRKRKAREFRRIRTFGAILKADRRVNSEAYSKIPYSTEQGVFAKEQGI